MFPNCPKYHEPLNWNTQSLLLLSRRRSTTVSLETNQFVLVIIYYMTEKITNARNPGTVILLALFLNENHAVLQMTEQF